MKKMKLLYKLEIIALCLKRNMSLDIDIANFLINEVVDELFIEVTKEHKKRGKK